MAETNAAVASAVGTVVATPRRPLPMPPPIAFECCAAVELLAAHRGWAWTVNMLIADKLLPLLHVDDEQGGGRSALIRLLGRLGRLAPHSDEAGVGWLRAQLRSFMAEGTRLSSAEQAGAVSSLLELLPPGEVPRAEEREALDAIGRWLSKQPPSWQTVSVAMRDRYHEAAARDDDE